MNESVHGTLNGYQKHGCRCEACYQALRDYRQALIAGPCRTPGCERSPSRSTHNGYCAPCTNARRVAAGNLPTLPPAASPGDTRTATIYALRDPRDGDLRYVGQTCSPWRRLEGHLTEARCKPDASAKTRWVRELLDADTLPEFVVLAVVGRAHRFDAEREWVTRLAPDGRLTNAPRSGVKRTSAQRV